MRHTMFFLLAAISAGPALAEVYKCEVNGSKVFQDAPCSLGKVGDNRPTRTGSRAPIMPADAPKTSIAPPDTGGIPKAVYLPSERQGNGNPRPASVGTPAPYPKDLTADAEIVVVSGYESSDSSGQPAAAAAPAADTPPPPRFVPTQLNDVSNVMIDRPGKKVLLVLSSHTHMSWQVSVTPKTTLQGILLASGEDSHLSTRATDRVYRVSLPYAYKQESPEFVALLDKLNSLLGIKKIDAFQGNYTVPKQVRVADIEPGNQRLRLQGVSAIAPKENFDFHILSADRSSTRWNLTGPQVSGRRYYASGGRLALTGTGAAYTLGNNGLTLSYTGGKEGPPITLPANFPELSWPTDVAYDSKRGIVAVVSLGGEGYFYRYDVRAGKWLDYHSMNNIDLNSLAYDAVSDRYVGTDSTGQLAIISKEGVLLGTERLAEKLEGFTRLGGSGRGPRLAIYPKGRLIALVGFAGNDVARVWLYNEQSRTAQLTFNADEHRP